MEAAMEAPQKIKNSSSNSTSAHFSKENKNTNLNRYMHTLFIAAAFTIAKTWKQSKCTLIGEWIKQMWDTHTHILHTQSNFTLQ